MDLVDNHATINIFRNVTSNFSDDSVLMYDAACNLGDESLPDLGTSRYVEKWTSEQWETALFCANLRAIENEKFPYYTPDMYLGFGLFDGNLVREEFWALDFLVSLVIFWRRAIKLRTCGYNSVVKCAFGLFAMFAVKAGLDCAINRLGSVACGLYQFLTFRWSHVDIVVQGSADHWLDHIRKCVPNRKVEMFSKRINGGQYRVRVKVQLKLTAYTYEFISDKSFEHAVKMIARKFILKKEDSISVQGILQFVGIKETPAAKFLKSVVFFAYAFWRSRTITDRVVAVTHWLDTLLDLGMGNGIDLRLKDFYHFFTKIPAVAQATGDDGPKFRWEGDYCCPINVKTQGISDCAEEFMTFFKGIFNSSSLRACFRLIALIWHMLFIFSNGKIDWEHLKRWDTAMFNSVPEKACNVGNILLEQISNLATSSFEFYKTRDMNVFLRNDNEVSAYLESVEKITVEVKNVPLEPALNASLVDLEKRVHDLIIKGETLRPKVKQTIRASFTTGLLQLRSLALDLSTMARASSTRASPFSLLVFGTPKIGKSSITSLIFRQFQLTNPYNEVMKNGLQLHDNGVYTRTLKEEYWSCYMNSYWGILFDDLGQTNPKCPDFALEINEIIQVVNNVMFFPQMASLEEKGKRYVAPQIVIATSNNKDLNSRHAVRSPGAVLRRFPYVLTPTVRPEFRTDNALDNQKVDEDDMDLWTFKIEEVVITNEGRDVSYRVLHDNLSTAKMLEWVGKASRKHYRGQAKSDNYLKRVATSAYCEACSVMKNFCICSTNVPHPVIPNDQIPRHLRVDEISREGSSPPASDDILDLTGNVHGVSRAILMKAGWVFAKTFLRSYITSYVTLWVFCQTALLACAIRSFFRQPITWIAHIKYFMLGRDLQPGQTRSFFGDTGVYVNFVTMAKNFFHFEPNDTVLFLWAAGWVHTAYRVGDIYRQTKQMVYQNPKTIAAIATMLVTASFLVWFYMQTNSWNVKTQGFDDDVKIPTGGKVDEPDSNIENTWKASQNLTFMAFLSPQSKTGSPEWFAGALTHATAKLTFSGSAVSIMGLNVCGSYWLVPKHFMKSTSVASSTTVSLVRASAIGKNMASFVGAFDGTMITECPHADFVLLKLSTPPGHNLLPYIALPGSGSKLSAINMFMREEGVVQVPADPISFTDGAIPAVSQAAAMPLDTKYRRGQYKSLFETVNGDCGAPCYINEKGKIVIIGTHVGMVTSAPENKVVNTLPIEWIRTVVSADLSCVAQGVVDMSKMDGNEYKLEDDVHKKCPIRFPGIADLPNGASLTPVGSISGIPMNHFSSKVRRNRFADFWESVGYVCSKVRPVLSSVGVPNWMPKRNFMLNVAQHKDMIPNRILTMCAGHYFDSLISRIPFSSVKKCVIIDEETNLHGAENHNFVSHMKFDTGAGFPHNKPKYEVLDRVDHPRFPDGTCALPAAMKEKIQHMEETAARGVRVNVVFNSSLKDEPISTVKLQQGKIRVFQAICIEGLFLLRKYFLTIIAMFQTWNFASEAAIGMDASGPDWDDIAEYLFQPGWKVFCGDYSNYDQRMGASVMLYAWQILIDIAILSKNYPTVAIRIMWVLAIECCYCVVNFFGDLICLNGSNPSGHGLTVVINSICNSLYLRIAWYDIFGNLDGFLEFVRLMTYGDDNIVSVHPKYQNQFNQITVTKALAKYGIVYTDAQKTGIAEPFCTAERTSFLKRGFVKSEHGFWSAPLEIASIHKMLIIGNDSGKVPEGDRLASVLISSVMESFHHGREFFDAHFELVLQCINKHDLDRWIALKGGLPSYEMLLEKRLAKISRRASLAHLMV